MRAFPAFAFLGLAIVVVGCNLIMDLGRFTDDDGGATSGVDAGGATGPFACVNDPSEMLDPGVVTLHLALGNATGTNESAGDIDGGSDIVPVIYTPIPGVTVLACNALDPTCGKPVTPPQITDDAGLVTFALTGTFAGFFRATSPTIVPITFAPGQWLTGVKVATYETAALAPSDEAALNGVLNNAVDLDASSGLGEVFLTIYDCNDRHVPGATFTLNQMAENTLPFYLNKGVPSTKVQVTDSEGVGGAVNVPHGTVHATATVLDASVTLGSIDVYVNAGELSYGWIRMRVH
jgi:hypothetical protein